MTQPTVPPRSPQFHYRQRRNATKSFFSCSVSFVSRTRLWNSTVSSRVRSRPSCRYGGVSLMPRSGNVLIDPSPTGHAAVVHLRLEEPLGVQVVHRVVGVVRGGVAFGAPALLEEHLLPAPSPRPSPSSG